MKWRIARTAKAATVWLLKAGSHTWRVAGEYRGPLQHRRFYYVLSRATQEIGTFDRLWEAKRYAEAEIEFQRRHETR